MATAWSGFPPPQRTRARAWILYEAWAGAAVFATLFALAATVSPEQPGHYPTCPFRALTGFACPGCGSLRALHDLAHGHFIMALTHNAMLVTVLPFAMAAWLRVVTGRSGAGASPRWLGYAALAVLATWAVVRNLPNLRGVLTAP
ncbi:MAG: DUF2752 domain-containing protein [Micromonosporaceae bacterium]